MRQIMTEPIKLEDYRGEWLAKVIGNKLVLQNNGVKRVYLVVEDNKHEVIYKVMKTRIKATDGGEGLASWLVRVNMEGMLATFFHKVWDNCKEC